MKIVPRLSMPEGVTGAFKDVYDSNSFQFQSFLYRKWHSTCYFMPKVHIYIHVYHKLYSFTVLGRCVPLS